MSLRSSWGGGDEKEEREGDFKELTKNCEYISGKVVQFLDKNTGLMAAKGAVDTRYGTRKEAKKAA